MVIFLDPAASVARVSKGLLPAVVSIYQPRLKPGPAILEAKQLRAARGTTTA